MIRNFRISVILVVMLATAGIGPLEAMFAPSANLWSRWLAADAGATTRIDHSPWDAIIKTYRSEGRSGAARFAYGSVSPADREALQAYLAALEVVPISRYSRPEQFAYWINLYNALTVEVVLDHYPVGSIRDINISPGLFARGPWGRKMVTIEGEEVSLNDIEHRILRPIWKDPRIHYAVNCAAVGCPDLQEDAFTASNTEALLNRGARAYVNDARGVRFENGRLIVSGIYGWFAEDFGGSAGVLDHLRLYAEPDLRRKLELRTAVDDHAYDWSLNATR
jgi:Protein of unknown function, DUF547